MNSFIKSVFTNFWIGYLFSITTFMFPTSYNWLFDNESQRQVIITKINLLALILIGITVKKLWLLKDLTNKTKSDWTFLIIFGYPIISSYFTWGKFGLLEEINKKIYNTKVIAKAFWTSVQLKNFCANYYCLKLNVIAY